MPSSATITSFYSFSANTKARATQVNTNFSNYRGHIIAIDPNTSTAATSETYDLGSTEYRWRTGYFREVDFKSNTSTGQTLQIVGDTAAGQGSFLFKHGGNTRARIGGGNGYIDIDTTTSQFDFKVAGSTLASFKNTGMTREGIKKSQLYTVSQATTGNMFITATLTKAFELSVTSNGHMGYIGFSMVQSDNTYGLIIYNNNVLGCDYSLYIYRDGTAPSNLIVNRLYNLPGKATTTVSAQHFFITDKFFDNSITAGGHTYYVYLQASAVTTAYWSAAISAGSFSFLDLV